MREPMDADVLGVEDGTTRPRAAWLAARGDGAAFVAAETEKLDKAVKFSGTKVE